MKNNEIVIFSVSKTITQRIMNVLIEMKLDVPVYEFRYSDVLDKANEMIQSGAKIIISRGGTAALLRNNISIPVIEIAHDFHGVYRILQQAKIKSQKIAAVGFPQFCNALRHYQNMTNEEFKICQVYNHNDIENVIKNLSENDYHTVIGGLTVAEMAKKYNLNAIMGDTDNISIEQAINEAYSLLKYINRENTKLIMSHAALNQAREGIMCIDQLGEIININAIGLSLFQCHVGDKIFKKEAFKDIYPSIINELDIKEQAVDINGQPIFISIRHFSNRQTSYSIITGLNQESSLWQNSISKKSKLRGFSTTWSFDDIIGQSPAIRDVIKKAKLCARHELPIHILGDTGTGKELFAQSIHNHSARSHGPFIAINCAAIPESILESELFGYADGAFTSARKGGKPGVFEMAMNGTVFIDEISEAPLSVQVKLLRVLQEKQFSRLGGDTLITADFRLITASNKDLRQLVASGEFRQDLYYRINILELSLPALRQRPGDIMLLIQHLLYQQGKQITFTPDAVDFLHRYSWPGNIRELQAVIYRLIVLLDIDRVSKDVLLQIGQISPDDANESSQFPAAGVASDETDLLKKQEKRLITHVIEKTDGDRTKASVMLGISPTTLWRKLKQHNISG
ncbi:sigma 54-interacting transcriptional regulator [Klebsiella michiganensis]|uniref:sigma 54-interacting transcriptional regulator n=1 Tax=Klebsiella michiganensis TaxID=1134687 RepID=UPI000665EDE7|nr:sigma 54-interacting transcriptional regulator [Klebsiella michiganensis]